MWAVAIQKRPSPTCTRPVGQAMSPTIGLWRIDDPSETKQLDPKLELVVLLNSRYAVGCDRLPGSLRAPRVMGLFPAYAN